MVTRAALAPLKGKKLTFYATVKRFSAKKVRKCERLVPTLLLIDIFRADSQELVTDHLWFVKTIEWAECTKNCKVYFQAQIQEYEKGYKGKKQGIFKPVFRDYRLENPSKIIIISP